MRRLHGLHLLGLRRYDSYHYHDLDFNRVAEVEQPAWPCLILRREALGPYIVDKDIPFYFLDVDMSKRLYDRGYKIYLVPQATITHLKSASFGRANESWKRKEFDRSIRVYLRKNYPSSFLRLSALLYFDNALRAVVHALTGREPLR